MIAYHVDSLGTLPTGTISLSKDYSTLSTPCQNFCQAHFPAGISRMGECYLMRCDPRECGKEMVPIAVTEFVFELVRQMHFSHLPSRFQSLFAVSSMDAANKWREELKKNFVGLRGCEFKGAVKCIEYNQSFCGDASLRDNFPSGNRDVFDPGLLYSNAIAYWSGIFSNKPKPELIVPLPVIAL